MLRTEIHSHTDIGSNIRFLDSINKVDKLISYANEIGLQGIAITDHEALSAAVKAKREEEEIRKINPNFKVILGNEIYLCPDRESGQKYYHFILLAKNKQGWNALKEISSRAWLNSFRDKGIERVVTTYQDLQEIVQKYPNSLIASTACLGGELSTNVSALIDAETTADTVSVEVVKKKIISFILWSKQLFGEDFYIEFAPGASQEQIRVNKRLLSISQCFNIPMVIGTDAHFLKKEDRYVHKAYLTSNKKGDREVDAFYEFSYLQTEEEILSNLNPSFDNETLTIYEKACSASMDIYNKIEDYSIFHKQVIPSIDLPCTYEKTQWWQTDEIKEDWINKECPTLKALFQSDNDVERYWVNQCFEALNTKIGKWQDHKNYVVRLEEEANIKKIISDKLETNMFSYPVTLQHYVDLFWRCGSIIGAGRGSSCSGLNHYLLGITQLDPIEWDLPFWRYLNSARLELGDIDLDLDPAKRPLILKEIKKERGQKFNKDIDDLSRENLGCTLVATFGTETTKSAILTACRGYRSEDFPDGIDVDIGQYLSSLVPSERGFLWPLKDVVNGNKEKDRKPVQLFLNEVAQYPGLLDIMTSIEGLVKQRGTHASGVIFFDEDPYEFGAFMRAPSGDVSTQFDLHDCEAMGMTKYDFLATSAQTKISQTVTLLQKANLLDPSKSLKEIYNEKLHPNVLPINDDSIWDAIDKNEILNMFQFDSQVGSQAAKRIAPRNIQELADSNGLMRLMTAEKGAETPMDKYIRFKNNISLWYQEMDENGLTKEEQKTLEPYFLPSYGVPPSQEQMMKMLMDKNICNFSLEKANNARKIVGKKLMSKIPELKNDVLISAKSPALGQYVWKAGIGPQMGYSFSVIHALAYSFIGFQTALLGTKVPLFWDTACLIVNSGILEDEEYDDDDNTKVKGTNYTKNAQALGEICSKGIKVSLIDINRSGMIFEADTDNNAILYGLKGVNKISRDDIEKIISNRPYKSIKDFITRCPLTKTKIISLIKAGAFDVLDNDWASRICPNNPRKAIMAYYISTVSELKNKLTLQNFNGLLTRNLIPDELEPCRKIFLLMQYLKKYKKGEYYLLSFEIIDVLQNICNDFSYDTLSEHIEVINEIPCIKITTLKKIYDNIMSSAKAWLKQNEQQTLVKLNTLLFKEQWEKYALGSISSWEMESLCFYYHEHELAKVNFEKYGIVDFNSLPDDNIPIEKFYKRKNAQIPIYKTFKIVGTVIGKDVNKSLISLLTPTGVVSVKLTKEYFAMMNKQISEVGEDGKKHILEKSWFARGTKLMITGYRREDTFVGKTYSHTPTHQIYKILSVNEQGEMDLTNEREKN